MFTVDRWIASEPDLVNTLQLFITNRCNRRCRACFYCHRLGDGDMTMDDYCRYVDEFDGKIGKVILLGGEPTIHPDLSAMLDYNRLLGLSSTIYTNGVQMERLKDIDLTDVSVRVGVMGWNTSEKRLDQVHTDLPIGVVMMLRKDNVVDMLDVAKAAADMNARYLLFSSIRDIAVTKSFWKDTAETLSMPDFVAIVQRFLDNVDNPMQEIHVARRGVITGEKHIKHCRFLNIMTDGKRITCPFDIALDIESDGKVFPGHSCQKNNECILQKLVLRKD